MTALRAKMLEALKLHRFSPKTQKSYLDAVAAIARFYNQSPDQIEQEKIKAYFLHLLEERQLSWSTCNVAISALRFLYTQVLGKEEVSLSIPPHKVQSKLPEIFTEKELESLFRHADTLRNRILLMTTYSGGLRVSEVVRLQIKDIDSERMVITMRYMQVTPRKMASLKSPLDLMEFEITQASPHQEKAHVEFFSRAWWKQKGRHLRWPTSSAGLVRSISVPILSPYLI